MDKKFVFVLAIITSLVVIAFNLESSKGVQKSIRMSRPGGYLIAGGEKGAAAAAAVSSWRKRATLGKMLGASIDPPPALDQNGKELTSETERRNLIEVATAMKAFSEKAVVVASPPLNKKNQRKRRSFTIITLASDPDAVTEGVGLATKTKQCYSERHGYKFINYKASELPIIILSKETQRYWNKVFAVNKTFIDLGDDEKKKGSSTKPADDVEEEDWVVWTDSDVAITDPAISLDDIVDTATATVECTQQEETKKDKRGSGEGENNNNTTACDSPHLIVSNSADGINSGVFLMRRSEWSVFFMKMWYLAQSASHHTADNGPFVYALMREVLQQQQDNLQEALNKADREVSGVGSNHDIPESIYKYRDECDRRKSQKNDKYIEFLHCFHRSIREAVAATARAEEELLHRNKTEKDVTEAHDEEKIQGRGSAGIQRRSSDSDPRHILLTDTAAVWNRMSRCAISGKPLQSAWDSGYSSSRSGSSAIADRDEVGVTRGERVVQRRNFEFGLLPLKNRKIGYIPGRINDGPGWKPVAEWKKETSWIFHAAGIAKNPRSAILKQTIESVADRFDAACLK